VFVPVAVLSLREGKGIAGIWKRVHQMRDQITGTRKAGAGRVPFSQLCFRTDRSRAREQRGIPMWLDSHVAVQRVAARPCAPQATL
jgi:hypothetical protein